MKIRKEDFIKILKECVLEEARLNVLDWNEDEIMCCQNHAELKRLEELLNRLIPDETAN